MVKAQNEKLTTNYFLMWLNSHTAIGYVVIFLVYLLLASVFNWSLLLGENLMKWDIWIAEYPHQVLMSDALKNGEIMLWNPLMQYGTPTYTMVGTPIWYPITLLLALIGYNPIVLAFSYVIHIAIGGFGMFLLGQQELRERSGQWTLTSLMASIAAGLLYCNSGVFLSNAQHIMIIISAAWVPYVFYFMREYLEKKQMIYAMLAGVSAGMIFLGGYPELFYDAFLFLAPYTLYFGYERHKSLIKNILFAFRSYVLVGVCTVLCCAVSLIPFLNIMGDLTRTSGIGQIPHNPGIIALMSLLFPRTAAFALSADSSMINFYVGIITVLLLPVILKSKNRNKLLYLGMGGAALFVCLGSDFFLYEILFRFFPMYSSFRFPSVDRCIFAMFLLLNVTNALYEVMSKQDVEAPYRLTKTIFLIVLLFAVIFGLFAYMANDAFQFDKTVVSAFSNSAWFTAVVVGGYLSLFYVSSCRFIASLRSSSPIKSLTADKTAGFDILRGQFLPEKSAIGAYGSNISSKLAFAAGTGSGKRIWSIVHSNNSDNSTKRDSSGIVCPFSHLLTACGLIFNCLATSSCVNPLLFLNSAICFPAFTVSNISGSFHVIQRCVFHRENNELFFFIIGKLQCLYHICKVVFQR